VIWACFVMVSLPACLGAAVPAGVVIMLSVTETSGFVSFLHRFNCVSEYDTTERILPSVLLWTLNFVCTLMFG
jgi:hypothetical protein